MNFDYHTRGEKILTLRARLNEELPGWNINEDVGRLYDVIIGDEDDYKSFDLKEDLVGGLYGYDDEDYFGL